VGKVFKYLIGQSMEVHGNDMVIIFMLTTCNCLDRSIHYVENIQYEVESLEVVFRVGKENYYASC